jgi:hypothetical protein
VRPQQGQASQVTRQTREDQEAGQEHLRKEHLLSLQKKHHRKPHRVDPDKCMWNKKYKEYHFKSICDKLEVTFKPCHKFMAELGGYTTKEES